MSLGRRVIQNLHMGYELSGGAAALSAASGKSLLLFDAFLHNRSGASANLGMLAKQANVSLGFGTLVAANTPDFVDGSSILTGSAQNVFTTTVNSGFLVQSKKPFGLVCLTLTQAQTGAPVYTYQYYNGASYVTLTTVAVPDFSSTGRQFLVFAAPRDWVAGTTAAVGGDGSLFSIRVLATTAPGQAVIANVLEVGSFLHFQAAAPDGSVLALRYPLEFPYRFESGESLMPYFSVAAAANMITATYMIGE